VHFGNKPSRRRETGPYVDILNLVDELRLGAAGCVCLRTLGLRDVGTTQVLTLVFSGHAVRLVHVWEDLCEVYPSRL